MMRLRPCCRTTPCNVTRDTIFFCVIPQRRGGLHCTRYTVVVGIFYRHFFFLGRPKKGQGWSHVTGRGRAYGGSTQRLDHRSPPHDQDH